MIRGAPTDKKDKDKVASLFDKARQSGAVDGKPEDLGGGSSSAAFKGSARTLAGEAGSAATTQVRLRQALASS